MPRIYKPQAKPRHHSVNRTRRHELVYNDSRWRPLREQILQRDGGLCQDCLAQGRLTDTDLAVHHLISPFIVGLSQQDFDYLAWNPDNLITLCRECHNRRHKDELNFDGKKQ